jgi:GTP-binding protein
MFTNDPKAFAETYRRYLLGVLREHLPFAEVPVKLYLRKRQAGDQRAEIDSDSDTDTSLPASSPTPETA